MAAALSYFAPLALGAPFDRFKDCDVCPEMIELPLGEFIMGAESDEFPRNIVWQDGSYQLATAQNNPKKTDEGPLHLVKIERPFALGRNEITYNEWLECVSDGGCGGYVPPDRIPMQGGQPKWTSVGGSHPVLRVSFEDANRYVDWLNQKVGTNAYRLPTEAEWEYAARAGAETRFSQGQLLNSDQANFSGEQTEFVLQEQWPELVTRGAPVPVEDLDAANAWGLRHMSGNAGELTSSCYSERYASWNSIDLWLDDSRAIECDRVVRGGSYIGPMDTLRAAWRAPVDQTRRTSYRGFRILKELN